MTATATRPETEDDFGDHAAPTTGALPSVLGTGDHKLVGLLFLGTGLLFLIVSLVAGLVVAFERLDPAVADVVSNPTDVLQLLALERFGLLFLGVLPMFVGLGLYLTPLQVGAPTIAFPRAAAAGLWTWLIGAALQLASFGINGGPWGGEPDGVDLWASSTILLLGGLLLAIVCVVTTVVAHRAPGMSLRRVPLLSWSMLVAGSIWLASIPVLLGDLVLILVDHSNGRLAFGLNMELWGQVSWVLLAPTILMVTVPVLGVAADIIPVHAGARQRFHDGVLLAIAAFGVLTFGAWARPMLATDPLTEEVLYQGVAITLLLPLLLLIGAWGNTVFKGRLNLSGPMVASILGVALIGALALVGIAIAIPQTELAGTAAVDGVATAALLAAVVGVIAALGHWSPKLFGRFVADGAVKASSTLVFLGAVVVLAAEVVAGAYDHPALGAGPIESLRDTAEAMGAVVLGGYGIATLGVLLAALAMLTSTLGNGDDAEDDPWGGHTLEWATASPPPPENFVEVPMVTSAAPMLDARAPEEDAS